MNPWIVNYRPKPDAQLRLFCFPFAGGNAAFYREWPSHLPDIEISAVQMPGRGNRINEGLIDDMDQLLSRLMEEFRNILRPPYAFFGHSLGAVVAYELTRQLYAAGAICPEHLFLSARWAPHLKSPVPSVSRLSDNELLEVTHLYDGIPQELSQKRELIQLVLPVLRADFAISESYQFRRGPRLSCGVSLLGGLADKVVPRSSIVPWTELFAREPKQHFFPGNHMYIRGLERRIGRAIVDDLNLSTPHRNPRK